MVSNSNHLAVDCLGDQVDTERKFDLSSGCKLKRKDIPALGPPQGETPLPCPQADLTEGSVNWPWLVSSCSSGAFEMPLRNYGHVDGPWLNFGLVRSRICQLR